MTVRTSVNTKTLNWLFCVFGVLWLTEVSSKLEHLSEIKSNWVVFRYHGTNSELFQKRIEHTGQTLLPERKLYYAQRYIRGVRTNASATRLVHSGARHDPPEVFSVRSLRE